ncbi:peptidase domain-containing ABC transporter [Pseudomonas fluorescens]|uniref:Toxin RTX-I translocation ATP-binding protein n=1 Tax=Pseudomonas fluorescens TaxID=294 RepID=A0A5E7F0L4_PSEFL|nr:peptidase domain-containing ABC transporter [Pseudomonas fluorescens]VVO32322.1 Toxin RTX-I translocation ATP-binding protein [Pseudomonas fluorescens]
MLAFDLINLRLGTRLPLVLQTEAAECGLACLAMITAYHDNHSTLMELRQRFSISLKGSTLLQIIQIAQNLNLGSRAVRLDLHELAKLQLPCILHWNFNHFVVLESVGVQHVTIYDPARGKQILHIDDISHSFTGVALELWPENNFLARVKRPRIKLIGMLGRVSGLYRSLTQILLLTLVLEVFSLVSPFFLQWTIDNVLVSEDRDLLTTLVVGFGILMLMQQLIGAVRAWVMMYMSTMLSVQWCSNVFSHLLRLPVQYFEKRHLGDVVSRFGAVENIQQTLTAAFFSTVVDGLMAIVTLAMMFLYSSTLASITVVAMLFYALGRWIWYHPLRNATEEQIIHTAKQESHFLETIRGIRPLKLFQRLQVRRLTWVSLVIEQVNAGLRAQKLQLLYVQLNGLLFGLENLLTIWVGAQLVMGGKFTVGVLIAFTAYKTQFVSRVGSLIDSLFELHMLQLHGERLADIVLHPPEEKTQGISNEMLHRQEINIDIRGLKYRYSDQETFVLNGLDLYIKEGESVAIIGASGSGKSTLVSLLSGVSLPSEGEIRVAGLTLSQLGMDGLRELVGTVMQDDVLFAGSLAENISFFDSNANVEKVIECAKMAAIHDDIQAMPMAYNTLVGDMGTVLSGGQKQRVLLARALYKKPRILLLDEATSHLDISCEQRVNQAVRSLRVTRIIIAHRPDTIASADRVVMLDNGRIAWDEPVNNVREWLTTLQSNVEATEFP